MKKTRLRTINDRLASRKLRLQKNKNHYEVIGEGTEGWKFTKIMVSCIGNYNSKEWIEIVDELERYNEEVNFNLECNSIIEDAIRSEVSQDCSATSHYFLDDTEGYWSEVIKSVEAF